MAVYDFKCHVCGNTEDDVVLPMSHTPHEKPRCCGGPMQYVIYPPKMIHNRHYEFEGGGFKTISAPRGQNEVITTHRKHNEFLKKHDLRVCEEPLTAAEDKRIQEEIKRSIDAISVPDDIARQLDIV